MVSHLFKVQRAQGLSGTKASKLKPPRFLNFLEFIYDMIPDFVRCKCCRKSQRFYEFQIARELLEKETNIVEMLIIRRTLNKALTMLFSKETIKKMREEAQYTIMTGYTAEVRTESP